MSRAVFAETAPELHVRGLNVVPVVPGHKQPGRGCTWRVWQTSRQTTADVEALIRRYPNHDIAVVLGMPRASLVGIESDSPEAAQWLAESGLPLPETVSWTSSRGQWRLYMTPWGPVRTSLPHPKLEIRGKGALAIVPPSTGRVWARPGVDGDIPTSPENLHHYIDKSVTVGWDVGIATLPQDWHKFLAPAAQTQHSTPHPTSPIPYNGDLQGNLSSESERLLAALKGSDRRSGEIVLELCRRPDVTQRLLALAWQREVGIEKDFHCLFVGHGEDRNPSAAMIYDPRSGTFVYHDRHRKSGHACFTQPEVAAAVQLGEVRKYRRADHSKNEDNSGGAFTALVCYLGALAQARMITPVENPLLPLPPDSPSEDRILHAGIGHLYGLRWLLSPGEPIPLAWNFLARWCDLPERYVTVGMHHLRSRGLLVPSGTYMAYGKQVALWLPGRTLRECPIEDEEVPSDETD